MAPLFSMPADRDALRAAAWAELRTALEAIRLSAQLIARGRIDHRERRLNAAIQLALDRAERALQRLGA